MALPILSTTCASLHLLLFRLTMALCILQIQWAKNTRGQDIPRLKHNPARPPSPDPPAIKIACRRIIVSPGGEWTEEQDREWNFDNLFGPDGLEPFEGPQSSTAHSSADTPIANTSVSPLAVSPMIRGKDPEDAADVEIKSSYVAFEALSGSSDLFLVPECQVNSQLHKAQKLLEHEDHKRKEGESSTRGRAPGQVLHACSACVTNAP